MTLAEFNTLLPSEAESALMDCCGCARWAAKVAAQRPFADVTAVYESADGIWRNLERAEWLEAFSHHPQIGEKAASGSTSARKWAEGEQAGARAANEDVKNRLAHRNHAYYEKFGYIYIVCATGKSADEMLALLEQRLENEPASELSIAAEQQRLITRLRLDKLFTGERTT